MTENLLNSKIELLEEQIANLEQSGFFTEKEIDRLSGPLKIELDTLQQYKQDSI